LAGLAKTHPSKRRGEAKKMQRRKLLVVVAVALLAAIVSFAVVGCGNDANESTEGDTSTASKPSGPITIVWYPNESSADYEPVRDDFARFVTKATGRPVEHRLTTDYVIALEALGSGAADIGAMMGAVGFIEVQVRNPEVGFLFTNTGPSGTLEDAVYYSWMIVPEDEADNYKVNGEFSIDPIEGKRMSFVSNSSTSGFVIPSAAIINHFGETAKWADIDEDDLIGPSGDFFSEVLFGQSHQGTGFNVISGRADVGTVADILMNPYLELVEGERNSVGAVYEVRADADAPFDTVAGKRIVIIESIPVFNGPYAYNPSNLTREEINAIIEIFTSDEAANNPHFFSREDGATAFYSKTENERFITTDDSWYDPVRRMMGIID